MVVEKPVPEGIDGEGNNSTRTAELINRNESQKDVDLMGSEQDSEILSESLPDIVEEEEKIKEKELTEDHYIETHLRFFPWYHGFMFGSTVERILKHENSFLVRRLVQSKSEHRMLCVSVFSDKSFYHFRLWKSSRGWKCNDLFTTFGDTPPKSYDHVHELLDAFSLLVNYTVPIPRTKKLAFHETVWCGRLLGKGAFGEVYKALYLPGSAKDSKDMPDVAVKKIAGNAKREAIQDLLHEASIMCELRHRNVVAICGLASIKMPVMILMELVTGGDLRKYVQRTSFIPNQQMLTFALDIARGLVHLAAKNIVHRDLAARNCLVARDLTIKISDFGLATFGEIKVTSMKKAPIRWLAPECIAQGMFNVATDVWAFGVLLTELLSRCAHDPLWPRDVKECMSFITTDPQPHRINKGLEPKELIEMVELCCVKAVEKRPTIEVVKKKIQEKCMKYWKSVDTAKSMDGGLNISQKKSNTMLSRKKSKVKDKKASRAGKFFSLRKKQEKLRLPQGMTASTPPTKTPPTDNNNN